MDRASVKKTEERSCHSSHFLPSRLLCSRRPSWRSGPRTWSSELNTSWTSRLWPVTQSNHAHTHSISSFSLLRILACISDFCEDRAIAPGLKCYIHVVGASYLIELACDHLKIIQLDMDVSCGVYREQCFGLHVQGEDRAGVHGGWTAGTRIWLSVHPRSRHVVLRREPCQK